MPRLNTVEICALLLCASLALARAEDWTTTNGKVYRNINVVAHTNATVTILDSDGGATLNLLDLSPALQKRFGMDRAAALAAKQQDEQEDAAIQAQKDKVVADEKARVDMIAANKAADAKESADDLKKLEDLRQKAAADYASMEKKPVSGQVYFTTSDKQEIDFAATHVRLFSYDQVHAALDLISARAGVEQAKLNPDLTQQKDAYQKLAASKQPGVGAKLGDLLKPYREGWKTYYADSSQSYYDSQLTSPVADVTTDADGKFTMPIPKTGSWVLVALGQRKGEANGHLWIAKLDPAAIAKGQITLNNDNLSGDNSLMTIMSDADIDSLVQQKMDEMTKK